MENFDPILKQLTLEQKASLLTGSHEVDLPDDIREQIPHIYTDALWNAKDVDGAFPSPRSLAHSWNPALYSRVAVRIARDKHKNGVNLFHIPSPSASISVYGDELSEDPVLATMMARGLASGMKEAGLSVYTDAPYMIQDEASLLDGDPDTSAAYERKMLPCGAVMRGGDCAVLMGKNPLSGEDEKINDTVLAGATSHHTPTLYAASEAEDTLAALLSGHVLLSGTASAVVGAVQNYKAIYHAIEEGGASAQELQTAVADGTAISEAELDKLLCQRFAYAKNCGAPARTGDTTPQDDQLPILAASESTVLLKNVGELLPLKKKTSVALIGDVIGNGEGGEESRFYREFCTALEGNKDAPRPVGYLPGYNASRLYGEQDMQAALLLSDLADVTLLFVGLEKGSSPATTHSLSLPANQVALAQALIRRRKTVVMIIVGDKVPDMKVDKQIPALLMIPDRGTGVPAALAQILTGAVNPGGRLAYSVYENADAEFRTVQRRKRLGNQKIGPYVGYRYADADGQKVKYPFGFGLSYSWVEYTSLKIRRDHVTFKIHNKSKMDVTEIPQLYLCPLDKSYLGAAKVLSSATAIHLKRGEKRSVTLPISMPPHFSKNNRRFYTYSGKYRLSVGSSYRSIHLSDVRPLYGDKYPTPCKNLSEYLQVMCNIKSEQFTMEAHSKAMKQHNGLKNIGTFFMTLAVLLGIAYLSLGLILNFDYTLYAIPALAVSGGLLVLGWILRLVGKSKIKKKALKQEEADRLATQKFFEGAEKVEGGRIEDLFMREFESVVLSSTSEERVNAKDDSTLAYMAVDTTPSGLCHDLTLFFSERGLELSGNFTKHLVSSLLSSRLLVLNSHDAELRKAAVKLLGEFFGSHPHTLHLAGTQAETLLGSEANVIPALEEGVRRPDRFQFVVLDGISFEACGRLLTPFIQYFTSYGDAVSVVDGTARATVSPNTYFIVLPTGEEPLSQLPAFVSNRASVLTLDAKACSVADTKTDHAPMNFLHTDALIYRAKQAFALTEKRWKNIDALEAFVGEHASYHLGNKICLQLEAYTSVYLSCEGSEESALDGAVSSKILPAILYLLNDKESMADVDMVQTVESIFGEGSIPLCCRLIKDTAAAKESMKRRAARRQMEEAAEEKAEATAEAVAEAPEAVPAEPVSAEPPVEETPAEAPMQEVDAQETPAQEATETPTEEISETPNEEPAATPDEGDAKAEGDRA